jgi:hypothetical protein
MESHNWPAFYHCCEPNRHNPACHLLHSTARRLSSFWLSPRTASGVDIAEIHRAAANLFPICDDSSSRKTGFSPHLTLGQVKGHTPDKAMLKALWPGGKLTCSRLFILVAAAVQHDATAVYEVQLKHASIHIAITEMQISFHTRHFSTARKITSDVFLLTLKILMLERFGI